MEQRRLTKMVDWIVAKATFSIFTGDERDGETPPITIENFWLERDRYGAKALRARLSRLSYAELLTEARAARAYFKARPSELMQFAELAKREELRQRQAQRGSKSRLQPAILAAARRCRDQLSAKEAWDAIKKNSFKTDDGSTVKIEGSKLRRLKQRMRVISPDGRQQKRSIGFNQWRQSYWSAAAKPG